MENLSMWYFEKDRGYQILNTCKIVHAHHNHCLHVKLAHYKRYNNDSKIGLAPFTSTLLHLYKF